jgi:hypothetical protein
MAHFLQIMSHLPGGVDARSDAEGHVERIRLGWIGASGFEQILQSSVPRSGEFGETRPGKSSSAMQQRHTFVNRSDCRILAAIG